MKAALYIVIPVVALTLYVGLANWLNKRSDRFWKHDEDVTNDMIAEALERDEP